MLTSSENPSRPSGIFVWISPIAEIPITVIEPTRRGSVLPVRELRERRELRIGTAGEDRLEAHGDGPFGHQFSRVPIRAVDQDWRRGPAHLLWRNRGTLSIGVLAFFGSNGAGLIAEEMPCGRRSP